MPAACLQPTRTSAKDYKAESSFPHLQHPPLAALCSERRYSSIFRCSLYSGTMLMSVGFGGYRPEAESNAEYRTSLHIPPATASRTSVRTPNGHYQLKRRAYVHDLEGIHDIGKTSAQYA